MDLKENDVKIFYGGGYNARIDKEIEIAMECVGYEFYASGINEKTQVRDLAFSREVHDGT